MSRTVFSSDDDLVPEGATPVYTGQLKQDDGTNLPLTSLDTLLLTYYNEANGAIINSRNGQDIKNNGAFPEIVVSSTGLITWILQPNDTAILTPSLAFRVSGVSSVTYVEKHVALIEWTWTDGAFSKASSHEVEFRIINLRYKP